MRQVDFNPYQEWLDLSSEPANYYELLGLRPFEADADVIRRAVRRVSTSVRNVKPGVYRRSWTRLLDQIDLARKSLCDPERKETYDRQLRAGVHQFETVDVGPTTTARAADESRAQRELVASRADAVDVKSEPIEPPPSTKPLKAPRPQKVAKSSLGSRHTSSRNARSRAKTQRRRNRWGLVMGAVGFVAVALTLYIVLELRPWPMGPVSNETAARATAGRERRPTARQSSPDMPARLSRQRQISPVDHARRQQSAALSSTAAAKRVTRPAPIDDHVMPMAPAEPTSKEIEQLNGILVSVWQSLDQRQFDRATEQLAQAEEIATTAEHQAIVTRHKALKHYVQEFWSAVRDGMDLIEDEELVLGKTRVYVVEVTPTNVVLHVLGERREYSRRALPNGLAMAIADRWFNRNAPSTRVIKGAFMAVTPSYTEDQVRSTWAEADRHGADVGDLYEVLRHRP